MPRRDDPQIGLGKAIRTFRQERQLSQETLGHQADIHPTWISHIESGRINPTWGNVRRIAKGLGVPLEELAEKAEELERKFGKPASAQAR
jgi:transcriptional regulator with XRE-family HTH domain